MSISATRLCEDLRYFHELLFDKDFMKSLTIKNRSEQKLLVPLKFFLAAIHVNTWPESRSDELSIDGIIEGGAGHPKRIDYWIDGIALEVASLSQDEAQKNPAKLNAHSNRSEIAKLSECDCRSILCLLDLRKHKDEPSFSFMNSYKSEAMLINKNRARYNFHLCYIYRVGKESRKKVKRIYQGREK